MKRTKIKIWTYLGVLISGICLFSIGRTHAQTNNFILETVPESQNIQFIDQEEGIDIRIDGYDVAGSPGDPDLPAKIINILLPPNADDHTVEVEIIDSTTQTSIAARQVIPAPPLVTYVNEDIIEDWGYGKDIMDGYNALVYGVNELYPENHVEISSIGHVRQWKVLSVKYYPIRFNPITKEVIHSQGGEFRISYNLTESPEPQLQAVGTTKENSNILKTFVKDLSVNFEQAADWYAEDGGTVDPTAESTGDTDASQAEVDQALSEKPGYFILTTEAIVNDSAVLEYFAAFKESQGFKVQLVTESAWNYSVGEDAANAIRAYLQNNYIAENIQYVLFIGDPRPTEGQVPMKMLWPRNYSPTRKEAPSDLFYADLTGNWDLDGDGYYGEGPDDLGPGGVDVFPEVIVGRIPYYGNINDLDSILDKLIAYEYGDLNGDWTRKVMLSMVPLDNSTPSYHLGEQIKEDIISRTDDFWTVRMYNQDYGLADPPDYTPCNDVIVRNAWAQHFGIHVWMTHGGRELAHLVFCSFYCQDLSDQHPSLVYMGSC